MEILDLLIVGAGPAGITAAIYAKRANINFALYEKNFVGGNVVNAYEIENYPGYAKINGADLAMQFNSNLTELGIDVNYDEIVKIDKKEDIFEVETGYSGTIYAKKVLLALGTKSRKLGIKNEDMFIGRGISTCATCDGNFYKGKDVLVVGGGNSAVSESFYLANLCNKVYIMTRHELKADKKEIAKIKSYKNIEVIEFKSIYELKGDKKIEGATLIDTNTKELSELTVDGIFLYIGQVPPTDFLNNLEVKNKYGFIEVNERYETKVNGLFAIGDCISKSVRQIVTAAGDAATAIHFINE
ncbi:MAG: FAD-dependent oxidoreductase [Bacilli bacterium]|nr:FAD-dependent oxidoreductase [Bacilli bacterium]